MAETAVLKAPASQVSLGHVGSGSSDLQAVAICELHCKARPCRQSGYSRLIKLKLESGLLLQIWDGQPIAMCPGRLMQDTVLPRHRCRIAVASEYDSHSSFHHLRWVYMSGHAAYSGATVLQAADNLFAQLKVDT